MSLLHSPFSSLLGPNIGFRILGICEQGPVILGIFGPEKDEIVRVIKPRRLRWADDVARIEEGRSSFKIITGKPTGKRPLGWPNGRKILD